MKNRLTEQEKKRILSMYNKNNDLDFLFEETVQPQKNYTVRDIQNKLIEKGYGSMLGPRQADGVFGKMTAGAILSGLTNSSKSTTQEVTTTTTTSAATNTVATGTQGGTTNQGTTVNNVASSAGGAAVTGAVAAAAGGTNQGQGTNTNQGQGTNTNQGEASGEES